MDVFKFVHVKNMLSFSKLLTNSRAYMPFSNRALMLGNLNLTENQRNKNQQVKNLDLGTRA